MPSGSESDLLVKMLHLDLQPSTRGAHASTELSWAIRDTIVVPRVQRDPSSRFAAAVLAGVAVKAYYSKLCSSPSLDFEYGFEIISSSGLCVGSCFGKAISASGQKT